MSKAKNLKFCRQKHGLSQRRLAEEIGVSKTTITSWETKKHAIPEPSTRILAEYFGVDYDDFCDEDFEKIAKDLEHGKLTLTEGEAQAILMFRKLPLNVKSIIRNAVKYAYECLEKEEKQK